LHRYRALRHGDRVSKAPSPTDDDLRLLTSKEVAALLQVSPMTIRRRVDDGDLRCVKLGNRRRFRRCDVDAFTRRLARASTRKHKP
jgi:excisionase family DNA binding protein